MERFLVGNPAHSFSEYKTAEEPLEVRANGAPPRPKHVLHQELVSGLMHIFRRL